MKKNNEIKIDSLKDVQGGREEALPNPALELEQGVSVVSDYDEEYNHQQYLQELEELKAELTEEKK